ncbi:PIP5K [Mytilus edulis]|uniref:PIP5K n=1 Tax=Mytilus edulis TaxID=6550 RepID=A0A8S3RTD6_MYTED|nr:PIP5K [Mytilus edulis]
MSKVAGQNNPVQTFDQQLYGIAKQVKWYMPKIVHPHVVRLGLVSDGVVTGGPLLGGGGIIGGSGGLVSGGLLLNNGGLRGLITETYIRINDCYTVWYSLKGQSIGGLSSKPKRDVLIHDFAVVESAFFPSCSEVTLASLVVGKMIIQLAVAMVILTSATWEMKYSRRDYC